MKNTRKPKKTEVSPTMDAFSFRLSQTDREEYAAIAAEIGIPLSNWMRMTLKRAAREYKETKK